MRSDAIHCDPGCGLGCTEGQYQAAVRGSNALLKRLDKGWKPRIWDNLGWHYAAISPCERIQVYPYIDPENQTPRHKIVSYSAFLNEAGHLPGGRFVGSGKTPQLAIRDAVRQAKAEATLLQAMVEGL